MDFREPILVQHARAHTLAVGPADLSVQDAILRDVPEAQLRLRPQPGFNSLAWLFWHMTRAEDIGINVFLADRPQVIDTGDWAARLRMARRDIGAGMSDDEVEVFTAQVDIAALLAYRAEVGRQTQAIIHDLRPEVLDEVIDANLLERARAAGVFGSNAGWLPERWAGKRKTFTLMHTVLAHSFMHLGQADTVRVLLGFKSI
jgi:hypothetical protein